MALVRAEWGWGGVGHAKESGVVEGLGMHWDSPWLKKERPSGAWGRFGEWVQQGEAATRIGQVGSRGAGWRGYEDRPSGAA